MRFVAVLLLLLTIFMAGCTQPVEKKEVSPTNDKIINDNENDEETDPDTSLPEEDESSENDELDENDGNNDPDENGTEENDNTTNEEGKSKLLNEDEAIIKVKEHLNITFDEEVNIVVDREEGGEFIIQVFDVIPGEDGVGHTATRGWYTVDRQTGNVESMF